VADLSVYIDRIKAGVVQVIECLPSKCEALSSNPTTTTHKKKDNKGLNISKCMSIFRNITSTQLSNTYLLNKINYSKTNFKITTKPP
jgi:hypothetical protein